MSANGASNGTANGASNGDASLVVPIQINGKEEQTSLTHPVTNPTTNKTCWTFSAVDKPTAIRAVESAAAAYPSWSKTKPTIRRDIFLKAADLLSERGEEYGGFMETETGAQSNFSTGFNIPTTVNMLRDIAGRIVGELSGSVPVCMDEGRSAMVLKEPYGVILGIAPWNAPYILGVRAMAYALATGNTVVLKGSELSPRCHWAIGKVFKEAGLPDGCLNVLYHRPRDAAEVTTALIEHRAVRKVNFTGSTAVGAIIAGIAGKNLKPCLMELGGKNSVIVCDDADLEEAAQWCVIGAFHHSGQICMSTDLIFAQSSIASKLKELILQKTSQIYPDSQPPILVTPAGVKKNKDIVSQAIQKGAEVIHGDPSREHESDTRLRPIILDKIAHGMDMYDQEAFGPTAGLVTIESEEEAIKIMNENDYGLSASVFTKDLARAFKIGKSIESGAVHINGMTVHDEANLPHGGWQRSGWGRFNGSDGFNEFLRTKTITWKDA